MTIPLPRPRSIPISISSTSPLPLSIPLLFLLLLLPAIALAQSKVEVQPGPTFTSFVETDGSGNAIYVCRSPSNNTQNSYTYSVLQGNLTNVVVASGVATVTFPVNHGFQAGYSLVISRSNTGTLNGTYAVVSANPASTTLTFSTVGVPDGTYLDMSIYTDGPLLTKAVWSISKNVYSGTTFVAGMTSGGDVTQYGYICANRAVVNGANVVKYK